MAYEGFYQTFDRERYGNVIARQEADHRTAFQIDRDRIIHTSAFRRLQSKTQVFFSGEYDFYRTRLTHSIEVAQIGRSLCNRLNHTSPLLGEDFRIDPDLVEAACLSHDIGHPPFGHTGERTLHRLMAPYGGFEGNAQTLRILTGTLYGPGRGMDPSRALLDAVLKYKTLFGEVEAQKNHFLFREQSEVLRFVTGGADFPADLPPGKTRNGFRSIECQIMDWADDTAYSLNDVADGIQAGFVTLERLERWAAEAGLAPGEGALVDELLQAIRDRRHEAKLSKKIGWFLREATLEERTGFLAAESARHRFRLRLSPEVAEACRLYKRISLDLVFKSRQLQQLDRKADFILTRLFEVFAEEYIQAPPPGRGRYRLLSEEDEELILAEPSEAGRARLVCDVLAKMTDGFASRTYKRLFDADFGSIVDLV